MERLDNLVLNALAERVFTPKRIQSMMMEFKKRLSKSRGSESVRLKKLTKDLEDIRRRMDNLLDAVERGLLSHDSTLSERAHRLKAQREAVLIEIAGIRREQQMPLNVLTEHNIEAFCKAMKAKLLDRDSNFGKEYLRLLVEEIRVEGKEVTIRGSYSALGRVLGTKKLGNPEWVPRFGDVWLPGQDSNLQPSG